MEKHTRTGQEAVRQGGAAQILLSLLILLGGIVFYYWYENLHALVRVGGVLLALVLSGLIFYRTETGRRWAHFLVEMRKELRLVVWPGRDEVVKTTLTIFAVVIVMGVFLWLVDMFFLWGVEWLTGRGS